MNAQENSEKVLFHKLNNNTIEQIEYYKKKNIQISEQYLNVSCQLASISLYFEFNS